MSSLYDQYRAGIGQARIQDGRSGFRRNIFAESEYLQELGRAAGYARPPHAGTFKRALEQITEEHSTKEKKQLEARSRIGTRKKELEALEQTLRARLARITHGSAVPEVVTVRAELSAVEYLLSLISADNEEVGFAGFEAAQAERQKKIEEQRAWLTLLQKEHHRVKVEIEASEESEKQCHQSYSPSSLWQRLESLVFAEAAVEENLRAVK